ncbi:carboxylating nicotinate-nucleotide diphosphorylase [Aquifex aeolicus]|uniref:Probable nicotinate-nucleotide pyrophosphorylase [carboxylating] n=1 Tax=Aquifex aeolicus (strain VF5) TaxID=224324 RepID=O67029_AQUAE|nr:carboxylating nicotinate-nucleotide diphosphorylase [Aquifex aeolicus]AAC06987.1 quinolinate phosphoribosyl transferase [Aquifex aeolicus VF5]
MNEILVKEKLKEFLLEDIGTGDITTEGIYRGEKAKAVIKTKEEGVLAGAPFVEMVFEILGGVSVEFKKREGEVFEKGEILAILEGDAKSLLIGERLSLNILQRLSGIATTARKFVEKLKGTNVKILDTRKTTPGFRYFEKYAVRIGGGTNHRFGLYDMVLIKDNHKRVAGSIKEAVKRVRERISPVYKIEVEVENLEEVEEALSAGVDVIMLDNFTPEEVKRAVEIIKGRALVEVSGNITLDNVLDYAVEGVDFISSGAIVHSSRWLDISLKFL